MKKNCIAFSAFLIFSVQPAFSTSNSESSEKVEVVKVAPSSHLTIADTSDSSKNLSLEKIGSTKKIKTQITEIPFEIKYVFNRQLRRGALVKVQDGQSGEIKKTWRILFDRSGKIIRKEYLGSKQRSPIHAIYHMGPGGYQTSRESFSRRKILTMRATAYDTSRRSNGGYIVSKTGEKLRHGIVAVDPRVIPLNSWVYVKSLDGWPDYGFAKACDIGGAIKGDRIDLCYPDPRTVCKFGRRRVEIHILYTPPLVDSKP